MPRKHREECPESFFHITNRSINKEWFVDSMDVVFDIFTTHLNFYSRCFNVEIISFVLMSNHYHLFARFPDQNRSKFMYYISKQVGSDLRKPEKRINRTWGNRYSSTRIPATEHSVRQAYKYVYANPLEAGICKKIEDYPYSTLQFLYGFNSCRIPVHFDPFFSAKTSVELLDWINHLPKKEVWEQLEKSFTKSVFKPAKDKNGYVIKDI